MVDIPQGYQRLDGSELHHLSSTRFLGPVNPNENITVLFILRRRLDGLTPPNGPEFFIRTPILQRQRLSTDEFAARYGASPMDISLVTSFAKALGLTVTEVNAARRTVRASGTVASMEKAFAVKLGRYQHNIVDRDGNVSQTEIYHGREGYIHLPIRLVDTIITVSGLDNRHITERNGGSNDDDPPNTAHTTVPEITKLYRFPNISAAGQTIAIFSQGGYLDDDIDKYFLDFPDLTRPTITDVLIDDATILTTEEKLKETTMDICIAASAAPGASIAVYFMKDSNGWIDAINKIAIPSDVDPHCSVLSSSYYVSPGDDAATLQKKGLDDGWIQAMTMAFQDAAIQGVTVCFASGDHGSASKRHCHKARVQYPPSDPWVLTVGGTTVGNIDVDSGTFDEYVWNERGATGGGISEYFPLPWYQSWAGVPVSANGDQSTVGRGIPDVAANSSPHSCYKIYITHDGTQSEHHGGGTSAAAPLWAGLITLINASLGVQVGFLNPVLYSMCSDPVINEFMGSKALRNISGPPGPTDNAYKGNDDNYYTDVPGYPSVKDGWDACTGLGSIDGQGLLACLAYYLLARHKS